MSEPHESGGCPGEESGERTTGATCECCAPTKIYPRACKKWACDRARASDADAGRRQRRRYRTGQLGPHTPLSPSFPRDTYRPDSDTSGVAHHRPTTDATDPDSQTVTDDTTHGDTRTYRRPARPPTEVAA